VAVEPLSCAQNLAALAGLGEPTTRPIESAIIAALSANFDFDFDITNLPTRGLLSSFAINLANATLAPFSLSRVR
jgi:hypothetical protein